MAKTYYEKLKDPRWQKRRLEILQRDHWKCRQCGDAKNTLHVHHRSYKKNTEPWEYHDSYLISLCEECHSQFTFQQGVLSAIAGKLDLDNLERLCGMAGALVDIQDDGTFEVDDSTYFGEGYLFAKGFKK